MMDGMVLAQRGMGDDLVAALAERAALVDQDGRFPLASLELLHAEGLLNLTARRVDGGEEAGLARCTDLVRRAGRGCASTALIFAMQLIHLRTTAQSDWPEHVRATIGRSAGRYGALINALRVEPALGTPARGGLPDTIARRSGDGWTITGRKIFSTGAPGLSWMLVFARTDEEPARTGLFVVPARSPGIRIEPTWDQLGLRGSGSDDVVFDDVRIPADHAVDLRAPAGWSVRDPVGAAWSGADGRSALHRGCRGGTGLARRVPARPGAGQSRGAAGHVAAHAGGGGPDRGAAAHQRPPARRCRRRHGCRGAAGAWRRAAC